VLIDDIKARMRAAMQARDDVAKNILSLALGEIQTAEARANRSLNDAEAVAVVRKLLKSNEETLALGSERGEGSGAAALRRENEILASLLPASMSESDISSALSPVAEALRAARNEGQAVGIAMKHLKSAGAVVQSADVQKAVAKIRA
jgi:uncharacterized protein YqeY